MFAGDAIAGLLAASIALHPHALSRRDPAYRAVVTPVGAVPFADIARLRGATAERERAMLGHWRPYPTRLLPILRSRAGCGALDPVFRFAVNAGMERRRATR